MSSPLDDLGLSFILWLSETSMSLFWFIVIPFLIYCIISESDGVRLIKTFQLAIGEATAYRKFQATAEDQYNEEGEEGGAGNVHQAS